jgi:hypothetical protein
LCIHQLKYVHAFVSSVHNLVETNDTCAPLFLSHASIEIKGEIAILFGEEIRLVADAPLEDLISIDQREHKKSLQVAHPPPV